MGRKRLITDSFRVVKKKKRDKEVKEDQSLLHADTAAVESESPLEVAAPIDEVELLRQFDLSWQYGPCTGITRLQRWERAETLGLSPPITVRELLLKYKMDPAVTYSLWHDYAF